MEVTPPPPLFAHTTPMSKQCEVLFLQVSATIEFGGSIFWFWVTVQIFLWGWR